MNTYLCFYKLDRITVEAATTYQAQQKAQAAWKLPEKKRPQIVVYLQAIGGTPYQHSTASI